MNPPFSNGADIAHVTHAIQFLAPGGRLVAILSAGVSFRTDKTHTAFRALLEAHNATTEPLPADTFKDSGTSVNTVLVHLRLPPSVPAEPSVPAPTLATLHASLEDAGAQEATKRQTARMSKELCGKKQSSKAQLAPGGLFAKEQLKLF